MARISDLTVNGDTHLLGNTYGTLSGTVNGKLNGRATNADLADTININSTIGNRNFDVLFTMNDNKLYRQSEGVFYYNPGSCTLYSERLDGHFVGIADNATKWNGLIDDHATENNTDTWIPVYSNNKLQHTTKANMTVGNAEHVGGASLNDILGKVQSIVPKSTASIGQFRTLIVNDSHQVKLPDGGTWAYFCWVWNAWSGGDFSGEHRTKTGAGIAAGGTVLHTDSSINSGTINNHALTGTNYADGNDHNSSIVSGFCWRIA